MRVVPATEMDCKIILACLLLVDDAPMWTHLIGRFSSREPSLADNVPISQCTSVSALMGTDIAVMQDGAKW